MKKEYKFELKIKNCPETFMEGLSPGVIASQVLTYDTSEEESKSGLFFRSLMDAEEDFLEKYIEVIITKI